MVSVVAISLVSVWRRFLIFLKMTSLVLASVTEERFCYPDICHTIGEVLTSVTRGTVVIRQICHIIACRPAVCRSNIWHTTVCDIDVILRYVILPYVILPYVILLYVVLTHVILMDVVTKAENERQIWGGIESHRGVRIL